MHQLPFEPRYILGIVDAHSKYPLNLETLKKHSAQDPFIWRDRETIESMLPELGSEYILGFVIHPQDKYFFIDLDKCLSDSGTWSEFAKQTCERFAGCYVEISISGKGLHIIGKYTGEITPHLCKNSQLGLELYTSGRFVALSKMNALGNASTIKTSELQEFIATYLIADKIESLENWTTESCEGCGAPEDNQFILNTIYSMPPGSTIFGGKEHANFKDLFTANAEELAKFYPSYSGDVFDRSSADSALAYRLHYFLGGNCERVREIMQLSELRREKWNRSDYLLRTILKARSKQAKYFSYHRKQDNGIKIESACKVNLRILEKTHYPFLNSTFTKPLDTAENLKFLFEKLGISARWDEMRRCRDIKIPGLELYQEDEENHALRVIKDLATLNSFPITRIDEHLDELAQRERFHPIAESILENPWDGITRIHSFIETLKTPHPELTQALVKTWMTQAIACAFTEKGHSSHGVLVLVGAQSIGKTRWIKSLNPIELNSIKEGAILDPSNKDCVISCASYWIVELGELDGTLRKADIARLKSHITNDVDVIRRPYARKDSKYARRTVYAASVNNPNFLIDTTGNRRFWTIPVESIDNVHNLDMLQIWAEIYELWKNGGKTWLSKEEEKALNALNIVHELIDPFEELLYKHYEFNAGWEEKETQYKTATEVLQSIGYSNITKSDSTRMAYLLRKITGYESKERKYLVPIFKPK